MVLLNHFDKVDRDTNLPNLNDLNPFNILKKELTEYVLFRR